MDFEKIFKELKDNIISIAKDEFGDQADGVVAEMKDYLDESKEKLKKWSLLFVQGNIDKDELAWLVSSQKDILLLKTLQTAGESQIAIGNFKDKVIDTLLDKLTSIVP